VFSLAVDATFSILNDHDDHCSELYAHRTSIEHNDDDDDDFGKASPSNKSSSSSSSKSSDNSSGVIRLTEVHLGCTIAQVLRAKGHVLEGGLLSLMVFPKANQAPSDVYLKRFGGRGQCGLLSPVG
jgi:hypothetical protein